MSVEMRMGRRPGGLARRSIMPAMKDVRHAPARRTGMVRPALRTGKESLFPARPSPHHPPRQPARWVGDAGGSPTFFMYRFLGMIKLL